MSGGHALHPGPYPSGLSRVGHLRGVRQRFLSYAFSLLLAGPGPSDSSGPSRTLPGLLPPPRAFPPGDCPQLHQAAATARRWSPLTPTRFRSASWRTSSCPTPPPAGRRAADARHPAARRSQPRRSPCAGPHRARGHGGRGRSAGPGTRGLTAISAEAAAKLDPSRWPAFYDDWAVNDLG